MGLVSDVHYL